MAFKTQNIWTSAELQWLRDNAETTTLKEAGAHFPNRTLRSLRWKAYELGLSFKYVVNRKRGAEVVPCREWTAEDIKFLHDNVQTLTMKEIAKKLGRTYNSTAMKIRLLKLPHKLDKVPWTKAEDAKLYSLCETHTFAQIAKKLGRKKNGVRDRMTTLGIHIYRGMYSLIRASAETGYATTQLLRAKEMLGQSWKRAPHSWTTRFLISEDQLDALCEYLKNEKWKRDEAA